MTGNRRLPAMLFGLLLFTQVGSAEEYMIQGVVRGGAEREAVTVIGVRSRNLHRGASAVVAVAGVDSNGTFQLAWDGPASLWLMVARQPSTASLDELVRAPMVLASHAPVRGGATDVILQVPSNQMTQSLWRGDTAENTPLKYIGSIVLLVLFFLGVWLRLRSEPVGTIPTHLPNMRAGIGWLLIALLLLGMRVGSEPLDLLEYSYFHEGVRPGSATAVLNDTISAELAHGPVTPLVLRGMALMSSDPFALRLPSVCFGALFVWFVWSFTSRLLGRLPGHMAAALALGAPLAFFYSRDATPYALTGMLAAISIWLALRASDSKQPHGWWLCFALTHVVGFFAHYGFAFFSVALGLTLLISWWRRPHDLSYALFAFVLAGILPVMQADTLFHMLELSGARFALMSPVYPESPGLLLFITQFLTVLSGLPEWLPQGLLVTIPLWCVGLFLLSRSAPLLAWFSGVQVLLLISWLVFSHTMSVDYGGGRVFYAYRWTRPLLLGIIVPFAGLALRPSLKWSAGAIAVVSLLTSAASIVDNLRPDVRAAVDHVSANAMSGDAWGVLPAGFYGDPVLYALHEGTPPSYITRMQTFDTKISDAHIRGPVMEGYQPFETAIDRLAYERIWTFEFAESMFGTPKFDPGVIRRTHAALQAEGWEQSDSQVFPFVHVSRYRCSVECEWMGARLLTFRLGDRLSSERYLALPAGRPFSPLPETAVTLVLPRETRSLTLKWSESTAGRAHLSDLDCMTSDSRMTCTLPPDRSKRVRTELQLSGGLTTEDIVVEVMR